MKNGVRIGPDFRLKMGLYIENMISHVGLSHFSWHLKDLLINK